MMLNLEILYLLKMLILRKLDITSKETSSRVIQGKLHVTAARWTTCRIGKNVIALATVLPIEFFPTFCCPAWIYSPSKPVSEDENTYTFIQLTV